MNEGSTDRFVHYDLPAGTLLRGEHGQRIKVLSMTADIAHAEHVTLHNMRDGKRKPGDFTGRLATGSWVALARKDHGYEPGAYSVCPRCGDEQEDHDRMAS